LEVVARTENLTMAAQALHVTQSAVSRQIGVLETYLGVELFRRERQGVALTRQVILMPSKSFQRSKAWPMRPRTLSREASRAP
jgi:hypothetical protein